MAFAQLTYRESLRDTILCLRAMHKKLHHVGIQGRVSRSTLADANEKRDWRIYCDYDQETRKRFTFLTNHFALDAITIVDLYKCRWQVELFFKWIKQHLRIKLFSGTSPTAVKTQIWIAISIYVLVAIMKKKLKLEQSLYTILQILSMTLFEKTPISWSFTDDVYRNKIAIGPIQLNLFES
jgi:hypothetical protein